MRNESAILSVACGLDLNGRHQSVLAVDGAFWDLGGLAQGSRWESAGGGVVACMLEEGVFSTETLMDLYNGRGDRDPLQEVPSELRVPTGTPRKVLALGRSFPAHAAEGGNPVPAEPLLFTKLPENLIAPYEGVSLPVSEIDRFDNEIELAAVFQKDLRNASEESAMGAVAGFTILNDITWRNRQAELKKNGHPWFLAKNLPGAAPFGPWLTPRDSMPDLNGIQMTCSVNGVEVLRASTSGLMWPVSRLLSWVTHQLPIHTGDVVSLGTPKGLSTIAPGDHVKASVGGVGLQEFFVVERRA